MQRIGFVLLPGFSLFYFAGLSVFEFANKRAGKQLYSVELLSEQGGLVRSSLGTMTDTIAFGDPNFDTLLVGGGFPSTGASPTIVDFVQRAHRESRRIASICNGAFVLAEAGILNGKFVTTHWSATREFKERFPLVKIQSDRIFTIDGSIWTSAGMASCIDVALAMVEKDYGTELARSVAQYLVVYNRRTGGQSQHSELLKIEAKSDKIQAALDYARKNLKSQLSVQELADAACLGPRQFSRAFRAETGQSPAKVIANLRLEAARLLIEQSRHPVEVVATETGFAGSERMRRAFVRAYGLPPQVIRKNAKEELSASDAT